MGASRKAVTIWEWVIEKIERRVARWKNLYFSKGKSKTFIKSTLPNLSTHFLSLFPLLTDVAKRIERIFENFCGVVMERKKFSFG